MAVQLPFPLRYGENSLTEETPYFRRNKSKTRTKKIQLRRQKLRFKHIMGFIILLFIIFVGLQQLWLFLISWDNLNINHIEVRCSSSEIRERLEIALQNQPLGNLLLLDLNNLQKEISSYNWVKTVQIRKILPSSLVIDIIPRKPIAVLKINDSYYLIDPDGIFLKEIKPDEETEFPILVDKNNFRKDYPQKINLARQCLNELPQESARRISIIDLSLYGNVSIKVKDPDTWIHLGNSEFKEKMEFLQSKQKLLENFQPLEYIDLRISGRLYFMPGKESLPFPSAGSAEEENNA